jgi:hypothetical protein
MRCTVHAAIAAGTNPTDRSWPWPSKAEEVVGGPLADGWLGVRVTSKCNLGNAPRAGSSPAAAPIDSLNG